MTAPLSANWGQALREEAPTVATRVRRTFGHFETVEEAAAGLTCKTVALGPRSQALGKGALARIVEILARRQLRLACGCDRLNAHRLTPCFANRFRTLPPIPEGQRLPLPEEHLGRVLAGYLRLFGIEVRMVRLDPIGARHTRISVDVEPGAELGSLEQALAEAKRAAVESALFVAGGNKTRAAALLGVTPRHAFRLVSGAPPDQCDPECGPASEAGNGVSRPG
ncbi:MAG: hypothetical protein EKK55_13750 [Rhodocyclaceae bacterium]|nr:MAG: hypothetical protein EKK55_13750 [Rhodocyclaceae bacterium]